MAIDEIKEEKEERISNDDLFNITSWGADPSVRELIEQYEGGDSKTIFQNVQTTQGV